MLFGDDVDDSAHRIASIDDRSRTADHFYSLYHRRWGHKGGLIPKSILYKSSRGVLAFAIDQNKRVFRAKSAHRDGVLPGFILLDIHTGDILHRIANIANGAGKNLFFANYANASWSFFDILIVSSRGYDLLA